MRIKKWLKANTETLAGRTVAISGATGGIGRHLCEDLASLGASLILLDRNSERSLALIRELKERHEGLVARHIRLDLEDMSCVRSVSEQLLYEAPHYLILNAGAYSIPRHKTDCGLDNVFQINFAAPYYLARTLGEDLRSRGGKVVAVSSIAHNYSHINESDIDFSGENRASKVYGNAKRFLTYSLLGAFSDGGGLSVVHPGITFTNITAHYPKLIFAIIKYPMKLIFMPARRAALCILRGVFEDCEDWEWIGPRIFNVWGFPKKMRLRTASESEARRICEISERIFLESRG